MKRAIPSLLAGLLMVTLSSCYPYGVPPGHAKRYGYWPGWNTPRWHAPGWYAPGHTRGIKPKDKPHPHHARNRHHR